MTMLKTLLIATALIAVGVAPVAAGDFPNPYAVNLTNGGE
jgi:hypothetical protein